MSLSLRPSTRLICEVPDHRIVDSSDDEEEESTEQLTTRLRGEREKLCRAGRSKIDEGGDRVEVQRILSEWVKSGQSEEI